MSIPERRSNSHTVTSDIPTEPTPASAPAGRAPHPWTNGRLRVELVPPLDDDVIVSQPVAPRLRDWLGG